MAAHIRKSLFIQVAGDALSASACVIVGLLSRKFLAAWFPISIGLETYMGIMTAALSLPVGFALFELYPGYGLHPVERLRRRAIVIVLVFGLFSLFDYLALRGVWSRGILLIAVALALIVIPGINELARWWLERLGWWGEPVAVYGVGERGAEIVAALRDNSALGWRCAEALPWPPPEQPPEGVQLAVLIPPVDAALPALLDQTRFHRVLLVPDFGAIQSQWISARDTGIGPGLELRRSLLHPASRIAKRIMDIFLIVLFLPAALFITVTAGFAVFIISPGMPLFAQERIGRDGRPFRLWKIRSMRPDADAALDRVLKDDENSRRQWEQHMKLSRDPRVIPWVGEFIRRWSIDELPQFFNVIRGEMSLVGPRPLPPYHVEALGPAEAALRTQVLPGITGLAQISGRSSRTVAQQASYDVQYIRNWSIWLDYYILMQTAAGVLRGRGAY